jgi:hypothetical protein
MKRRQNIASTGKIAPPSCSAGRNTFFRLGRVGDTLFSSRAVYNLSENCALLFGLEYRDNDIPAVLNSQNPVKVGGTSTGGDCASAVGTRSRYKHESPRREKFTTMIGIPCRRPFCPVKIARYVKMPIGSGMSNARQSTRNHEASYTLYMQTSVDEKRNQQFDRLAALPRGS